MSQIKRVPRWVRNQNFPYAGIHLVADFWHGVIIEKEQKLKQILLGAARAAQSQPLEVVIHKFSPYGITGVVALAESHIAIHTWPEIDYIAIDIFTCGAKSQPRKALVFLKKVLRPRKFEVREIKRGLLKKK